MDPKLIHHLIEAVNQEYQRRNSVNKNYSLRAYARYLNVDASHLLKFLRGKKGLSRARMTSLGRKLNLGENWLEQVQLATKRGKRPGDIYREMDESHFRKMYHWYYAAICELPLLPAFQASPEWISKKLNISVAQASEALNALKASGMFFSTPTSSKKKNAVVRPTSWTYYRPGQTSTERRENQKQFLRKAILALDEIPIEERDQSTMVMIGDAKNLSKARLLAQKFRRDMSKLMQKGGDPKELYVVSVSLFPLTGK